MMEIFPYEDLVLRKYNNNMMAFLLDMVQLAHGYLQVMH